MLIGCRLFLLRTSLSIDHAYYIKCKQRLKIENIKVGKWVNGACEKHERGGCKNTPQTDYPSETNQVINIHMQSNYMLERNTEYTRIGDHPRNIYVKINPCAERRRHRR